MVWEIDWWTILEVIIVHRIQRSKASGFYGQWVTRSKARASHLRHLNLRSNDYNSANTVLEQNVIEEVAAIST